MSLLRSVAPLLFVPLFFAACSSADPDANEAAPTATATSTATAGPTATPEPTPVPEPDWVTGDSSYLFDQNEMRTYELELSEEDLAFLDADPTAEEYVEAQLSFEGETIGSVGLRYKGSIGAWVQCVDGPLFAPNGPKTCTKLSMKVKVNWDDSDTTFYGVKKLQLHAANNDPSIMRDRLGYYLFREMGVAGPRAVHARLVLNGEFVGVFVLVEQIDGRFTRENFDDGTGNVYKEVWPLLSDGTATSEDALRAALKTNEDEDPNFDLMTGLAQDLLAATDDEVPAVLENYLDIDAMLAYAAVDRAIGHDDGPYHWYCLGAIAATGCAPHNFYWYANPTTQKLYLIPWDLDNALDGGGNPVTPVADAWGETSNGCEPFAFGSFGIEQLSASCDKIWAGLATFEDRYDQAVADLLAGPMSPENVTARIEEWREQVAPAVIEANQLHSDAPSEEQWNRGVDRTLEIALAASES